MKKGGNYSIFARLNCASGDDDSFWLKVDDGAFKMLNGLGTRGWGWVKLTKATFNPGKHTMTIGHREDGAKLDKISITNDRYAPKGMGQPAMNVVAPT